MTAAPRAHSRLPVLLLPLLFALPMAGFAADSGSSAPAGAWSDSLLLDTPDFEALRPDLLTQSTAEVSVLAWELVPRLIVLERPDLLVDFLQFWQDRCGNSEPLTRTRILGAIWDGAFDEGLYDAAIAGDLDDWELRDPPSLTDGRRAFDAFTVTFADQLLPHQVDGSLSQYFCLVYSDRPVEAADLLAEEGLADTWLRWHLEHPDGTPGGKVIPAADDAGRGGADASGGADGARGGGPSSLMLTVGGWWPGGDVALAGDHVLVGALLEQRLGAWLLRVPLEIRLGRTARPYLVDQQYVNGYSNRFDALYLGVEFGREIVAPGPAQLEAFFGLGYDGIRPFLKEDVMLGTLNANFGIGLRWQPPGSAFLAGLDARREWLATRNEGPDSLSGSAWSLRLGAGRRFGRDAISNTSSR